MINRNFKNIYENVCSNIQDSSTAMQTIVKRYVNDTYFDLLKRINFKASNHDYSFTASAQDNVLPSDFGKELAVYDATNLLTLSRTTQEDEIDHYVSSIASTGTATRYTILDSPVRVQPSSAGTISFVSSSASDNTQTILVRGVANGVELTESISLNGTTPAVSTNSFTRYRLVSKSDVTTGYVTGTHGSDTTVLMAPEDLDYRVKIMRLYATPGNSITINCPYVINPLPLKSDYDSPIIDAADVIELGATSLAWLYKRQNNKAKDSRALYEQAIDNLVWSISNQPNEDNLLNIGSYSRDIS